MLEKILNFCQCIFTIISLWKKMCAPSFKQTWVSFTQGCFVPSLWLLGRKFLNLVNLFSPFRNHLLLEKSVALHSKKLESSLPKNALCQVWLKLAKWFWRIFLNFVNVFSLFRNYLPLEKVGPFIWTDLNSLHPRMISAKFTWNWLSGSGKEDFKISST